MTVIRGLDERGNVYMDINSKRIFINVIRLKELISYDIIWIHDLNSFCDLGQAHKIDRGVGLIKLNFKKLVNPKHSNCTIKRKIIKTLAHEVRHILQPRGGRLLTFLRKLNNFIDLWRFRLIFILLGITITNISVHYFVEPPIILSLFPIGIAGLITGLFLFSIIFYYFLSPHEKDARRFAKEAVKDRQWLEVVKVEDLEK